MTDDYDPDKTPPRTSSAMQRLGLAVCPVCDGKPEHVKATCTECNGGGRVTLARHHALVGLKPAERTDTPVPPTEPDPSTPE